MKSVLPLTFAALREIFLSVRILAKMSELLLQQYTPFPRLRWEKEVLLRRTACSSARGSERSAAVKLQATINGLLPTKRGPLPFIAFAS